MTLNRSTDWPTLIGAMVEIRQGFVVVRRGIVDDAMPDSSALWIAADGVQLRTIYDRGSGYEVWVTPEEKLGLDRYRFTVARLFASESSL